MMLYACGDPGFGVNLYTKRILRRPRNFRGKSTIFYGKSADL